MARCNTARGLALDLTSPNYPRPRLLVWHRSQASDPTWMPRGRPEICDYLQWLSIKVPKT